MTPSSARSVPAIQMISILFAGLLAISASAILIRMTNVPSLSIAFWRVAFSLLLVAPLWFTPKRWNDLKALTPKQRWQLAGAGLCLGFHFWAWIASLAYTSVAASVLLVTTNPIWVGLLSPWIVGERLRRRAWFGIAIAMIGTTIIALSSDSGSQSHPLLGNALALLGAIAASGYLLFGRSVRAQLDLWTYASGTLAGAFVVLAIGVLTTQTSLAVPTSHDWGLLFAMALLPQMIGHNAISWSLRYIRADVVSLLLLLEPVGSALLAVLFLQEWPSFGLWVGGPVMLIGIAIVLTKAVPS